MSTELSMLVWSGLLSLTLALAVIAIHFSSFGAKTIRGNRDAYPELTGPAGRIVRAHANLNEALLPFAIVVLVVLVAAAIHVSNEWTAGAAVAFLGARVAHAVLYAVGATPWRSIFYYAGLIATLTFAAQIAVLVG